MSYYYAEVFGTDMDLHSGSFGGSVHEPLNDLIWLMSNLTDVRGSILIPGITEMVAPLTAEEEKLYDTIEFDMVRFDKKFLPVSANSPSVQGIVQKGHWRCQINARDWQRGSLASLAISIIVDSR
jgi:hypothetical protein